MKSMNEMNILFSRLIKGSNWSKKTVWLILCAAFFLLGSGTAKAFDPSLNNEGFGVTHSTITPAEPYIEFWYACYDYSGYDDVLVGGTITISYSGGSFDVLYNMGGSLGHVYTYSTTYGTVVRSCASGGYEDVYTNTQSYDARKVTVRYYPNNTYITKTFTSISFNGSWNENHTTTTGLGNKIYTYSYEKSLGRVAYDLIQLSTKYETDGRTRVYYQVNNGASQAPVSGNISLNLQRYENGNWVSQGTINNSTIGSFVGVYTKDEYSYFTNGTSMRVICTVTPSDTRAASTYQTSTQYVTSEKVAVIGPASSPVLTLIQDNSMVRLSWTTLGSSTSNKYDFEIQRSIGGTNNYTTIGTVAYSSSKSAYSYDDVLPNDLWQQGNQVYYYRIHRKDLFNWGVWSQYFQASNLLTVNTDCKKLASLTAEPIAGTNTLEVKWTLGTSGIWNTSSQNGVVPEYELRITGANDKTYTPTVDSTSYIITGLSTCESYNVQLIIKRDGSTYSSLTKENVFMPSNGARAISTMSASKGYFSDYVQLSWSIPGDSTDFDYFSVLREPVVNTGNSESIQLTQIQNTGLTTYSYQDQSMDAGVYYKYTVNGYKSCGGSATALGAVKSDIGYCQPYGSISGRVTYTGSQAVSNVNILVSGSDENSQNRSIRFDGKKSSYISSSALFTSFPCTYQSWIWLDDNSVGMDRFLFAKTNFFDIKIKESLQLELYLAGTYWSNIGDSIPQNTWAQLTVTVGTPNEKAVPVVVYLNGDKVAEDTIVTTDCDNTAYQQSSIWLGNGNDNIDNGFIGYMDEIRIWNIALDSASVSNNYNAYLSGKENGLVAYYRCDEVDGINQLFDMSAERSTYHKNDATLSNALRSSEVVPTASQLCNKTTTDVDGNYLINTVPYTSEGSQYKIIPSLGVHEFNPSSSPLYVSPSSRVFNNINFTDESSFEVSGYVYYENTNYPVEGAYLYVDGTICSKESELIQTAANGAFTISVPIGNHSIMVKKNNHTFVNEGRYPADPTGLGLTYTFDKPMSNLTFYDNTMVTITGRVSGGTIEEEKPYGMGASNANIGKATITLSAGDSYQLNLNDTILRCFASPTEDVNSVTTAGKYDDGSAAKNITIKTDPKTGEFAAMVPPIDLRVASIKIDNNADLILPTEQYEAIQLSGILTESTDTLWLEDGSYQTFSYVYALDVTHRSDPVLEVSNTDNQEGAFGEASYSYSDAVTGTSELIDLYSIESGVVNYTFGYPVFEQLENYSFDLYAYEPYYNYDDAAATITDKVPLDGVVVSVANELGAQMVAIEDGIHSETNDSVHTGDIVDLAENQVQLNSEGKATYTFQAGFPNIVAPYTLGMNITYDNNGKTEQWSENGKFNGIVLGDLPTGNNFVTAGPDKVMFILRDPPGTASSAYMEEGTTITYNENYSNIGTSSNEVKTISGLGAEVSVAFGVGVASITKMTSSWDLTVGVRLAGTGANGKERTMTLVTTERISTADNDNFVGEAGDVYIGSATNLIFGSSRQVGIRPKTNQSGYEIDLNNALVSNTSFSTAFKYSQNYVESFLIPNWYANRNGLITEVSSEQYANYQNQTNEPVYISTLSKEDARFGSSNQDTDVWGNLAADKNATEGQSYKMVLPENRPAGKSYNDTIVWINSQIKAWTDLIAYNEHMKVIAIETDGDYDEVAASAAIELLTQNQAYNKTYEKEIAAGSIKAKEEDITKLYAKGWKENNHSFDAGASYENSVQNCNQIVYTHESTFEAIVLAGIETGFNVNGIGVLGSFNTETGYQRTWGSSEDTTVCTTVGYTLKEDGNDDALTVDVFHAPDGFGPIFYTRGGQTCCPYEPECKTRYYEPGQHTLAEATMQIEYPRIRVENDYVTDIPSGSAANYTILLDNLSEIAEDRWYQLSMLDASNPDGAAISIDGVPLSSGRQILIRAGETTTKTLQLRQTRYDVMEYSGIGIVVSSICQNDETAIGDIIADTIYISAQFIPSCSDITMSIDNRTLNTETGDVVTIVVKDYDLSYTNFKGIRIQYRGEGSNQWNLAKEYVVNEQDKTANNELITGPKITLNYPMSSLLDYDQTYQFRAITVCDFGSGEVYNESETIEVVKDMSIPTVLGTPTPINGILTGDNEASVLFNETIKTGNLSKANNFSVRGVLNGYTVDHAAALKLQGEGASTEAFISLNKTDFTAEMWLNYTVAGNIFEIGTSSNLFTASITTEDKLQVKIGANTYTSTESLHKNTWMYLSISYQYNEDAGCELTADYAYDAEEKNLFNRLIVADYSGEGKLQIGRNMTGALHEFSLWNITRDFDVAQAEMYTAKYASTEGLIGYWPLNEGTGTLATDKARSRHLTLPANSWYLANENYAATFDGNDSLTIDISCCPASDKEDYLLECWFLGAPQTKDANLFQLSDSLLVVGFHSDNSMYLIADGWETTLTQNNYLDNAWHHFAFNMLRNGNTIIYVDGVAVKQIASSRIPALAYANILFGNQWMGAIDEIRFWKANLTADAIRLNMQHRLSGDEAGLVAYYPLEKTYTDSYQQVVTEGCLEDLVVENAALNKAVCTATLSDQQTPALQEVRSTEDVSFSYTASDTKIVIGISESAARIEGCTLEFQIKNVTDANGNYCSPIIWTAYINRNQLKWEDASVDLVQETLSETTFKATISNESGQTENWTVTNLPSWLSANVEQGSLPALSSKDITFTVASSTPIGKYETTIYLVGNNSIKEPFVVRLQVTGESPDWSVDPSKYETSMNIIGQLQIADVPSEDAEDIIAAFVGEECVGLASPVYYSRYDGYYVIMDVYGNAENANKEIVFKVWDAGTGIIYPSVATNKAITYQANTLIGTTADPYIWNAENKVEQTIALANGWNWNSLFVQEDDMTIEALLKNIKSQTVMVKNKTVFGVPSDSSWAGKLDKLTNGEMYKIRTSQAVNWNILGELVVPAQSRILVYPGWNWIGYNASYNLPIADAFAGLDPQNGDQVKGQTGFAIFQDYEWIGTLKTLAPGRGYMYYSQATDSKTFAYPSNTVSTRSATVETEADAYYIPVSENLYSGNMTMIAVVKDGEQLVTNAEVGVFAGTECRTAESIDEDGLLFLTISGEGSGTSLVFRVYVDGNEKIVDQNLSYSDDAILGSLQKPYEIQLQPTGLSHTNSGISVYPTHVTDFVRVVSTQPLQGIRITDADGRLLMVEDYAQDANRVESRFNLSSFSGGIYFVRIETIDGNILVERIVK